MYEHNRQPNELMPVYLFITCSHFLLTHTGVPHLTTFVFTVSFELNRLEVLTAVGILSHKSLKFLGDSS
jgi:hypothetical protein